MAAVTPGKLLLVAALTLFSFPWELRAADAEPGRAGDFYPVKEFREGVVRVLEPGKDFIRGDANLDRELDLSDAVTMLDYLFLGGLALGCEDSADADGNDVLEISDPILLLGFLFLGSGAVPAPHPGCGPDPAPDGLSCDEESCGRA